MSYYPLQSKIYNIKADSLDPQIQKGTQHSYKKIYNIKADSLDPQIKKGTQDSCNKSVNSKISSPMSENSNSLSGLLVDYNSDSEHEDVNTRSSNNVLDAKVDNFLEEINQLGTKNAPKEKIISSQIDSSVCAWQECYDGTTGYPYYWNVDTNAVTWEMPSEYKEWLVKSKSTPILPEVVHSTTNNEPQKPVNKEKPEQSKVNTEEKKEENSSKHKKKTKIVAKRNRKKSSESEDEKIVMITSFSDASSSESESEKSDAKEVEKTIEEKEQVVMGPHIENVPKEIKETPSVIEAPNKKEIIENVKDENIDETIILARLRTQAKVLHELGGELPKSVDKNILSEKFENANKPQSLCLVAGYGNDSDHSDVEEQDTATTKSLFPIAIENHQETSNETTPQSTLFPATKPIDVKQFESSVDNKTQSFPSVAKETDQELVDNKVFKRKKRLGIAFDVKTEKKFKSNNDLDEFGEETRKGFGFQSSMDDNNSNDSNVNTNNSKFSGISFKKGGIAFVKADVLNPSSNDSSSDVLNVEKEDNPKEFENMKEIVTEKVLFLQEGKDPVSPVQIMSIQLQTLEAAYKAQGLTKKYFFSWLRETFVDLEKLEKEAAPEGWTCQWDRSNKRYFYQNTATGETQWHYPDQDSSGPDIVGGGEAMDICTTPPHNEDDSVQPEILAKVEVPVPSPTHHKQKSLSPPPPPVITSTTNVDIQPPIPTVPPPEDLIPPPPPAISFNQPLPPGVDDPEFGKSSEPSSNSNSSSTNKEKDSLGSELDSFYSDLALIEASQSQPNTEKTESVPSPSSSTETIDVQKKKKKSKPKIGQGITMKKKAVSSLVEKWKKVQNDYI